MMQYRNAKYVNDIRIDCEIKHPTYGWIPYTLDPNDTDMTVNNEELLNVMYSKGDVTAYVPPTQEELDEISAQDARRERDAKLYKEVDVIAGNTLRWASLTQEQKQAWADYRQALLDVPQQEGFPNNIAWPVKPE